MMFTKKKTHFITSGEKTKTDIAVRNYRKLINNNNYYSGLLHQYNHQDKNILFSSKSVPVNEMFFPELELSMYKCRMSLLTRQTKPTFQGLGFSLVINRMCNFGDFFWGHV